MSKEMLKELIDIIDDNDVETIFRVLIRFVPEDEPLSDELAAIANANISIAESGTIPHDAINWD